MLHCIVFGDIGRFGGHTCPVGGIQTCSSSVTDIHIPCSGILCPGEIYGTTVDPCCDEHSILCVTGGVAFIIQSQVNTNKMGSSSFPMFDTAIGMEPSRM